MIDWLSLSEIPCTHDPELLFNGMELVLDKDNNVILQKNIHKPVMGSHDNRVSIRTDIKSSMGRYVQISGNPSKFFQGHNLFGSNDVLALSQALIYRVLKECCLSPDEQERGFIDGGLFKITRVDITESWAMASRAQVKSVIRALSLYAEATRRGRGELIKDGTVYWGRKSRYWTLKGYCKGDEIQVKNHTISPEHPFFPQLTQHADNLLRMELCLRGKQLKKLGLSYVANWREGMPEKLYKDYLEKLTIPDRAAIPEDKFEGIPNRLMRAYSHWLNGDDVRRHYAKTTVYRHRRDLLDYGVDIFVMRGSETDETNKSMLLLKPLFVSPTVLDPDWAKGTICLFDPKADDSADGAE
ncbi:MAG: phage/plasmid replication protein, II/X family [Alphaproteobacteria bacterium]|nr:phage/plasmid replication protein, II/X family [Alphaproteobacteria bacterium]